jgi:type II secretory pathway pseudopilin PulG
MNILDLFHNPFLASLVSLGNQTSRDEMGYAKDLTRQKRNRWLKSRGSPSTTCADKPEMYSRESQSIFFRTRQHGLDSTRSAGFTLVETIIAIAILVTAVGGVLSSVSRSISAGSVATNQMTAIYLAQEAIEAARWVRDSKKVAGSGGSWLQGISQCLGSGCSVDVSDWVAGPDLQSGCSQGDACSRLQRHSASGLYGHQSGAGWNDTVFLRHLLLESVESHEQRLTATVTWTQRGTTRNIVLRENIFDW